MENIILGIILILTLLLFIILIRTGELSYWDNLCKEVVEHHKKVKKNKEKGVICV